MSEEFEKLNYGAIGDGGLTNDEKIAKYTGDVDWEYVEPHFRSGNVIYVDPEIDLTAVAKAFSDDDKDAVKAWKQAGDIVVPSAPHADWWAHDETRFMSVIVHPFVIIQPMPKVK